MFNDHRDTDSLEQFAPSSLLILEQPVDRHVNRVLTEWRCEGGRCQFGSPGHVTGQVGEPEQRDSGPKPRGPGLGGVWIGLGGQSNRELVPSRSLVVDFLGEYRAGFGSDPAPSRAAGETEPDLCLVSDPFAGFDGDATGPTETSGLKRVPGGQSHPVLGTADRAFYRPADGECSVADRAAVEVRQPIDSSSGWRSRVGDRSRAQHLVDHPSGRDLERPAGHLDMCFRVDSHQVKDGGRKVFRRDATFGGKRSVAVTGSDDLSGSHPGSGQHPLITGPQ
ncbi:MAG: hypothetical protein Ct9H300mP1_34520 [Planctomycetaceae bacterium]|nr:MAG: hypothetical protein Ct9H300mP1_34520 [Planctomycetaceae bacterium]